MAGATGDRRRRPRAARREKPPLETAPAPSRRATRGRTSRPGRHDSLVRESGEGASDRSRTAHKNQGGPDHPWDESESFRETTLQYIADLEDRAALRRVGRMLYDMALETARDSSQSLVAPSTTRSDLEAIVADLRYLEGYSAMVGRASSELSLPSSDDALARFAGKLARRVGALVRSVEERLMMGQPSARTSGLEASR